MSYNYDYNPWDDNNANNPPTNQYQTTGSGAPATGGGGGGATAAYSYGAAASGYSNPAAQYAVQDDWNTTNQPQALYSDQPITDNYQQEQQDQYQQQPIGGGPSQQEPAPPSGLSRFLRAHVPLCGACMDITTPVLDILLKYVNRDLLASKIFYFFFYSAFGSLFPLMGVYFKQLGMNPAQVGILTGVRPFIEIFSAPFWNSLAERFQKSKVILLFSLFSWIVFTYSLAHIRPPASACIAFNDTDYVLYTPYSANDLSNYDVGQLEMEPSSSSEPVKEKENEMFMNKVPSGELAENKDEILINEENVNDQGRRRRKRSYLLTPSGQHQSPALRLSRYTYSTDNNNPSRHGAALFQQPLDQLDIDLENDFDDTSIDREADSNRAGLEVSSFFENPDPVDSLPEYKDELDQQASFSLRSKRSPVTNERGESDDLLGESESIENDHEREGETKGEERSKLRMANSRDGDEAEEESEEESQEKKESKHDQRQQQWSTGNGSSGKPDEHQNMEGLTSNNQGANKTKRIYKQRHKTPPTHIVGMSPITVEYAVNYNKEKHGQFVTPMFSTIVYKLDDIKEVFFLLLLLISLGEFFSAPAITIADSTTLSCLGVNTDLYGRQRMFGSIGWAITLFLVGMALDNSTRIADHPCGPHQRERSYTVCFTIFSLLMGCAFITATQFKFNYGSKSGSGGANAGNQNLVTKAVDDNTVITTTVDGNEGSNNIDDLYASTRPREIFNTAPPVNAPPPGSHQREKFEFLDKWKSAVFAQSTWELPEWVGVFRQFQNTMHLTYLFITWFLGCGVGLVLTFLFWHLQDVGGTPTLFGICSIINHISEILAYFFSSFFIKRFGHTKVSWWRISYYNHNEVQ